MAGDRGPPQKAAQTNACIKNLKTIDEAKHLWGIKYAKSELNWETEADLIGMDKYIKTKPVCPTGGTYVYQSLGDVATCSEPGHSY